MSPPPLTDDTDTSSDSDDKQGTDSVSESKDPGTDAELESVLHRRAGRPRAPTGSAADTARNAQRRKRAREKLAAAKLEEDWRAAVAGRIDLKAKILQQELLLTVRGRTLFPSQTKLGSDKAVISERQGAEPRHGPSIKASLGHCRTCDQGLTPTFLPRRARV